MRISRSAAIVAATGALALPATSLAAKPAATFKGHTSQGKAITVQYFKTGKKGLIRIKTDVVGACPVQGFGASATMSTRVGDQASGGWPIPPKWSWDTKKPTYEIQVKGKGHRVLKGKLHVTWQTSIDNAPTCTTPTISWKATKR